MKGPEEIRAICQRGKEVDPGWYRIHRRISIYLTWALLHTSIKPNQVSLIMMALGMVGAVMLASTEIGINAIGFAVLYLAFLLDKVDGEIARYRGLQSIKGILLDRVHHLLIEPAIVIAAAYREFQLEGSVGVLFAGFATVVFANVIDEHQHLAPYILFKHLRETGAAPPSKIRAATPAIAVAMKALKALKGFRMFIVVLPLLALVYTLEWITRAPVTRYYLYASAVALGVFVWVQSWYYYRVRLEQETEGLVRFLGEREQDPTERPSVGMSNPVNEVRMQNADDVEGLKKLSVRPGA
jgi:phosphatidylglycerophosphate synthase